VTTVGRRPARAANVALALVLAACTTEPRNPWPDDCARLLELTRTKSKPSVMSTRVWQLATCEIVAVEPADSYVDEQDRALANWLRLRVVAADADAFVAAGQEVRVIHDPAFSAREHGVRTPVEEWRTGDVRLCILEHLVGLGIVWKNTRLTVLGPRYSTVGRGQ
jgi:hypothetical protein